jgi:hypothetical protein
MKLDLKRIRPKIQFVQDNLTFLRELAAIGEAEFVADRKKTNSRR